jgi:hypothetical protein
LKELGMQQRFRRVALFVGAASLAGAGLIVAACGTDNGDPIPTPNVDSGKGDANNGKDTSVNPDPDSSVPDGGEGGVDCTNSPKLRDFTNNFRCAFIDAGGSDAGPVCQNDQTCCNTSDKVGSAFQPSYCTPGPAKGVDTNQVPATCKAGAVAAGSTFNAGNQWECADKHACGAGQICCIIQDQARLAMDAKNKVNIGNTPATDTKHPAACGVKRVYNEGGSRCRTPVGGNCPDAVEIKLCSMTDNNCGAGTVCTPFIDFQNFVDRGYCK